MILAAAFALLVAAAMSLARLFIGPTLYDRVLAVNSFGTTTVLFLAVFAAVIGRPDAIDIALLYALINFVATIAILKFFRYRAFDVALAQMSAQQGRGGQAPAPNAHVAIERADEGDEP